ncbi:class I adenylate-forming enzyme family protein [Aliiroseovarius sp. PTFE2010]|uniref:class I adenylate-forming enzyme family protein n=1 Tax=Aliiroseovarius sp. PTFE2010 TaxID=3417190 RepID=UPI003CF19888
MAPITPATPAVTPAQNVVDLVRAAARRNPAAEAVVCDDRRLTWAQFDARINRVANALIDLGVGKGARVAALSPNSADYAEVFMGTLRAGACMVPLSTMAPGAALEKMVRDSGSKMIFVAEQYRDLAAPFIDRLDIVRVAIDFDAQGWQSYDTLLAGASQSDPMVPIAWDDPFNIIYSSGTTGTPKGILHNHWMRAVQQDRRAPSGYDETAITLLSTPLYSNTTIVAFLPALAGGGAVHLMRKFDARGALDIIARERITHAMLVPVQYKRIMEVPDFDRFDLSSVRVKLSTSAPLRADVKRDVLARFPGRLVEYYGLTEGGASTVLHASETPTKLHTVGQPAPQSELKFIGPDDAEVAPGEIGEIVGRSATMMSGYFGRDDLSEDYVWHDDQGRVFFRSGDMGWLDEDGFLVLSDRKKDMIISGGLNIYADDLEQVLLGDPDVTDAAVIAVPSDTWGETPLGLVVLRKNARDLDAILTDANAKLGKSHRISALESRADLPRSSIGKVLKRALRAPYWDGA